MLYTFTCRLVLRQGQKNKYSVCTKLWKNQTFSRVSRSCKTTSSTCLLFLVNNKRNKKGNLALLLSYYLTRKIIVSWRKPIGNAYGKEAVNMVVGNRPKQETTCSLLLLVCKNIDVCVCVKSNCIVCCLFRFSALHSWKKSFGCSVYTR